MEEDPHEDLEKLNPLHAQSDTAVIKARGRFPVFLKMKIIFFKGTGYIFLNPPTLWIQPILKGRYKPYLVHPSMIFKL